MKHLKENIRQLSTPELSVYLNYVMKFVNAKTEIIGLGITKTYSLAQLLEAELCSRTIDLTKEIS